MLISLPSTCGLTSTVLSALVVPTPSKNTGTSAVLAVAVRTGTGPSAPPRKRPPPRCACGSRICVMATAATLIIAMPIIQLMKVRRVFFIGMRRGPTAKALLRMHGSRGLVSIERWPASAQRLEQADNGLQAGEPHLGQGIL